ncbi:MAG TPA: hypothetical protein VMS63_00360 [Gaiellaceae bacterium]|nr:hypothetical protein [Gaiellaceae bacterium]
MEPTPFTIENLPPLGSGVRIAHDLEKPIGERFKRGESVTVSELRLAEDGRVYVGVRTDDGLVFRATFLEAFIGLAAPEA